MQTQQLIAAAQQLTGLTELGDESILANLNRLVDAFNNEARLNAGGAARVEAELVATLAGAVQRGRQSW